MGLYGRKGIVFLLAKIARNQIVRFRPNLCQHSVDSIAMRPSDDMDKTRRFGGVLCVPVTGMQCGSSQSQFCS